MIAAIDEKREALGINKKKERVLMDMAMRRDLEAGKGVTGAGCGG
jgi:carbon-monoxide dehydrogenase catalytic subunit